MSNSKPGFYEELSWRGFIHTSTEGAAKVFSPDEVTGYIGFDPTASSLHVGSLLPIMGLVHLQRFGHHPIAIAGGGTGMIGDPSGKTLERRLLSADDIGLNLEGIKRQLSQFLDFRAAKNPARIVNNADWLGTISMLEFLRGVGKYFSVNEMLAKDSVKSRIDQEQGMSFTEFSYSLLQSYDYLQLFDRYGCTLQMGGSDQWGNIVSGVALIRRMRSADVHGIVFPLLATSTGEKFGKSESGTVWLDAGRTSPYRFYQFWYNTDDRDVLRYLRLFTLLPREKIAELESELEAAPQKRSAQAALASEVTRTVHGESSLSQAVRASRIFFGGELSGAGDAELLDIFSDVPSVEIARDRLGGSGMPLLELLSAAGVAGSKGEGRRSIQGGGIYLNNKRVSDPEKAVTLEEAVRGKFIVLRKGARNYFLVKVI
ncbi:MAG TPA: tyrosine--tRNA ligase [Bacteroidota bacterium]|jgi:tyrosyl-tRNA synthetase